MNAIFPSSQNGNVNSSAEIGGTFGKFHVSQGTKNDILVISVTKNLDVSSSSSSSIQVVK